MEKSPALIDRPGQFRGGEWYEQFRVGDRSVVAAAAAALGVALHLRPQLLGQRLEGHLARPPGLGLRLGAVRGPPRWQGPTGTPPRGLAAVVRLEKGGGFDIG